MTNEQHIENLKKLKSFHNGSYGADIDRAIKALEQEPKWIPVSERLPRTKQYALITVHNQTRMCWYKNGVFIDGEQNAYTKENEELVAWMPLPEPYKAESEE